MAEPEDDAIRYIFEQDRDMEAEEEAYIDYFESKYEEEHLRQLNENF